MRWLYFRNVLSRSAGAAACTVRRTGSPALLEVRDGGENTKNLSLPVLGGDRDQPHIPTSSAKDT